MKTEQIDVPFFEGFKCVGYRVPQKGQYYLKEGKLVLMEWVFCNEWLVYEKIPPKRYVFEKTGERRRASHGEYYLDRDGDIICHDNLKDTVGVYTILRRIDE